jgi:hypothetical protein
MRVSDPTAADSPLCRYCQEPMRLEAVAPHQKYINLDIHLCQCDCGSVILAAIARTL